MSTSKAHQGPIRISDILGVETSARRAAVVAAEAVLREEASECGLTIQFTDRIPVPAELKGHTVLGTYDEGRRVISLAMDAITACAAERGYRREVVVAETAAHEATHARQALMGRIPPGLSAAVYESEHEQEAVTTSASVTKAMFPEYSGYLALPDSKGGALRFPIPEIGSPDVPANWRESHPDLEVVVAPVLARFLASLAATEVVVRGRFTRIPDETVRAIAADCGLGDSLSLALDELEAKGCLMQWRRAEVELTPRGLAVAHARSHQRTAGIMRPSVVEDRHVPRPTQTPPKQRRPMR